MEITVRDEGMGILSADLLLESGTASSADGQEPPPARPRPRPELLFQPIMRAFHAGRRADVASEEGKGSVFTLTLKS